MFDPFDTPSKRSGRVGNAGTAAESDDLLWKKANFPLKESEIVHEPWIEIELKYRNLLDFVVRQVHLGQFYTLPPFLIGNCESDE